MEFRSKRIGAVAPDPVRGRRKAPIETVESKWDCCGCGACAAVCGFGAVRMKENILGFMEAVVDSRKCTGCGKCGKVCVRLDAGGGKPGRIELYAVKNLRGGIRAESSSGGFFRALAEWTIGEGGVVFGVEWNAEEMRARHVGVEKTEDLGRLQGSKYVQSDTGGIFRKVREELRNGKRVLFSGTPCQTSALRKYLAGENADKLLLADIVCHGVPSPKVLRKHLDDMGAKPGTTVKFRDKTEGWRKFSLLAEDGDGKQMLRENLSENAFLRSFLSGLSLNPACNSCSSGCKLRSDVTMADYWNIAAAEPNFADDLGVSAVLLCSEKGRQAFEAVRSGLEVRKTGLKRFFSANRNVWMATPGHGRRAAFFAALDSGKESLGELCGKFSREGWFAKMVWKARRHWRKKAMAKLAEELEK